MEELKVSIIVPVYNTNIEYFRQCIKSLVTQTYENIEIVIVDDGSKEENVILYKQYIMPYKNIEFIHQKNCGVSAARNRGIEKSTGEYIAFVDSDDWVDPNFVKILMTGFSDSDAEISICSAEYVDDENCRKKECENLKVAPIFYSNRELYLQLLYSTKISGFLCNKIFKKNLITQKLNETLYYSEDFVFTAQYSENVKRAVYWDRALYHYRQNQNSVSNDFSYNNRIFSLLKSNKYLIHIYEKKAPECLPEMNKNILKIALNLRARYKLSKPNNIAQYDEIVQVIYKYLMRTLTSKKINIREKVNIILTFLFPVTLFKVKNKILGRKIR